MKDRKKERGETIPQVLCGGFLLQTSTLEGDMMTSSSVLSVWRSSLGSELLPWWAISGLTVPAGSQETGSDCSCRNHGAERPVPDVHAGYLWHIMAVPAGRLGFSCSVLCGPSSINDHPHYDASGACDADVQHHVTRPQIYLPPFTLLL